MRNMHYYSMRVQTLVSLLDRFIECCLPTFTFNVTCVILIYLSYTWMVKSEMILNMFKLHSHSL